MGDVLGYARVSTGDQDLAAQRMCLEDAGTLRVFEDVRPGRSMDRAGLQELLAYARSGDTLAVVRLHRLDLAFGLPHLILDRAGGKLHLRLHDR